MRSIQFSINEDYYNRFKLDCELRGLVVKKRLNVLLSQDVLTTDIQAVFPKDAHQKPKRITLKLNEELYKGIMKNCDKRDVSPKTYLPFLIYKSLL